MENLNLYIFFELDFIFLEIWVIQLPIQQDQNYAILASIKELLAQLAILYILIMKSRHPSWFTIMYLPVLIVVSGLILRNKDFYQAKGLYIHE